MNITLERTRIIIEEYDDVAKRKLERLVSTMDKILFFEDIAFKRIYIAPGLLEHVKKLFPKIPVVDKSTEFWPYASITTPEHSAAPRNQLQTDFINFVLEGAKTNKKIAGILSVGTGKAVPVTTKIPTPDGYKRMGNIVPGDKVIGSDGKPTEVLEVYPNGDRDVYKISFNDNRYVLCDLDHQWNVFKWDMTQYTVTTRDMLEDYKKRSDTIVDTNAKTGCTMDPYVYKYSIPVLSNPAEYNMQDVPIDPYVYGAFLHANKIPTLLSITTEEEFIPNKIARVCDIDYAKHKGGYYFKNTEGYILSKEFFKDLPLDHIDDRYKYNTIENRLKLITGLLDSGGIFNENNDIIYYHPSVKLLKDVQEIIRGLGHCAHMFKDKSGIRITVPCRFKKEMFTVPSKLHQAFCIDEVDDYKYYKRLVVKDIRKVTKANSKCIAVAAKDKQYLTEGFVVTHNTFMACYSAIKVGQRTLIIVPTANIRLQWVDTLVKMFNVPSDKVLNVTSPKDFLRVKADFVVVTHASLAMILKQYNLEKIMKDNYFGIKVIDEVQLWFHNILKIDGSSNICNNWYLTGTFGRSSEDEDKLYHKMFGDLNIFRELEKPKTLFNRNPGNIYGMKPHMRTTMVWMKSGVLNTLGDDDRKKLLQSWKYSKQSDKWTRIGINISFYTNKIIPPDGNMTRFLRILLETVVEAEKKVTYGKTMVLVASIAAVDIVAENLTKLFPDKKIGTIHSKNNKRENLFAREEADILVSTAASVGTGFDLPGLAKLIVGQQMNSRITTEQVSGRLRRRPDGKETFMWDIVDASIPQLRAWARNRSEVLKRRSISFDVVSK